MEDDVCLAVSSDVVIFFDSLADHLKHFGSLRRVPLCAYNFVFLCFKGYNSNNCYYLFLLNKFRQRMLHCKNYSTFESDSSREIKKKIKNLHLYAYISLRWLLRSSSSVCLCCYGYKPDAILAIRKHDVSAYRKPRWEVPG